MTSALKSLMVASFVVILATVANAQEVNWTKVDAALGRKGTVTEDVHRYAFPRTDLNVTLDGVTIKPALALGSRLSRCTAAQWSWAILCFWKPRSVQ